MLQRGQQNRFLAPNKLITPSPTTQNITPKQTAARLHGLDQARQFPVRVRPGHDVRQALRVQQPVPQPLRHAAQHAHHRPGTRAAPPGRQVQRLSLESKL